MGYIALYRVCNSGNIPRTHFHYVLSSWLLALWLSSEASLGLTLLDFSREKHGFPIHGGLTTHASVHTQTL